MKLAPDRSLFYSVNQELTNDLKDKILADQEAKKVLRVGKFEEFVSSIENGDSAEELIRKALDLGA